MQNLVTLQARLDEILRIAKSNERKHDNFQQYELLLLNSNSLDELISIILEQHKQRFQLTEVTLMLHDPEYELQRLIENQSQLDKWPHQLLFTESSQLITQHFSVNFTPRLLRFSPHLHSYLFPDHAELGSVALLPLIRHGKLIGSLNLGSRNPARFEASIGSQFLQHLAAVVSACLENARLTEHIKLVGLRDPLTGINNRRFFDQRLAEETSRSLRFSTPLSCLFIDLDYFKRINDHYGHQAGDAVLKQVCELLSERVRQTDILARYGGEEFVILLADTQAEDAYQIAEQLRIRIAETQFNVTPRKAIEVTLSVGVATMVAGNGMTNSAQLVEAADKALYVAKISGRNQTRQAR